jgi:hypothetical protein
MVSNVPAPAAAAPLTVPAVIASGDRAAKDCAASCALAGERLHGAEAGRDRFFEMPGLH